MEVVPFHLPAVEAASQASLQAKQSQRHLPFSAVPTVFPAWRSLSESLATAGYIYFLLMIPEADCGFWSYESSKADTQICYTDREINTEKPWVYMSLLPLSESHHAVFPKR